jgi:hypothetical protein
MLPLGGMGHSCDNHTQTVNPWFLDLLFSGRVVKCTLVVTGTSVMLSPKCLDVYHERTD